VNSRPGAGQSAAPVAHSPVKAATEGNGAATVPGGGKELTSIHSCTSRCGFLVHTCFRRILVWPEDCLPSARIVHSHPPWVAATRPLHGGPTTSFWPQCRAGSTPQSRGISATASRRRAHGLGITRP